MIFFVTLFIIFSFVCGNEFESRNSTVSATSVSRSTVHSRMQGWVDDKVPYSQTAYYEGYRTDCSGYVSMGWETGTSYTTSTLYPNVCTKITQSELNQGDAMLKVGTHVIMFDKWVNSDAFYAYQEQQTGTVAMYYETSYSKLIGEGYFACKYKYIID